MIWTTTSILFYLVGGNFGQLFGCLFLVYFLGVVWCGPFLKFVFGITTNRPRLIFLEDLVAVAGWLATGPLMLVGLLEWLICLLKLRRVDGTEADIL